MGTSEREEKFRTLAAFLDKEYLPEIYGERMAFVIITAPFGERPDSRTDYISNGDRESVIQWLKDTLARFEQL